jgi:hypothetical protein
MLQHPFMAIFAVPLSIGLTHDQDVEIDPIRLRRAIEERHMAIIMGQRNG